MFPEKIDNKARKIQEIANNLGWDSDMATLVKRVKQLDDGLIQEDEFTYILNWSGNCKLIHKLDQFHAQPNAIKKYSIPDLFVVFNNKGIDSSYFIEIKTSKDNKLSWTEKYYDGLLNYSEATGIPILIAWKWNNFETWSLFELKHFKKATSNYKINFETAHTENLMSKLAGAYFIVAYDEIGLHLKFKKNNLIEKNENKVLWDMTCESIHVSGNEGKIINNIDSILFSFLFSLQLEEKIEETETHINYSLIPINKSIFAQSIPIRLSKIFAKEDINWLSKIKNQDFPMTHEKLFETLKIGIDKEFIRNILFTIPKSD